MFQRKGEVRRAMRRFGRAEDLDQPGRNRDTGRRYALCDRLCKQDVRLHAPTKHSSTLKVS